MKIEWGDRLPWSSPNVVCCHPTEEEARECALGCGAIVVRRTSGDVAWQPA